MKIVTSFFLCFSYLDRGFYLFERKKPEIPLENSANDEENSSRFDEDEELWEGGRDTPVHIVIVSLWFWWREVVLISLLTAFSFHMIITRQVRVSSLRLPDAPLPY